MARSRIQVSHGNDELTFVDDAVTFGGRTGVDIVLEDVMAADRHCTISYEDGFVVHDSRSVTGTWVDGKRAASQLPLHDGAQIVIGTTKVDVAIGEDAGVATLELKVDPQSFYWKKPSKGTFDNDPDQLIYSESKFARFRELQFGNRAALIVGAVVLLAATFVTSVMEPLADPGKLSPSHFKVTTAALDDPSVHAGIKKCVELSGEQGCNVCHTTGSGTPEKKCLQCHGLDGELGSQTAWRHPYHEGYFTDTQLGSVPGMEVNDQFCVLCHTDHVGNGEWLKPIAKDLLGKCAPCHDNGEGNWEKQKQDLIDGFTVVTPPAVKQDYQTYEFPHKAHLAEEIDCKVCHRINEEWRAKRIADGIDNRTRHDYEDVRYEVCKSCHVEGAEPFQMTAAEQDEWRAQDEVWRIDWHGTDEGGKNCKQCHSTRTADDGSEVVGPEMKTVERVTFSTERYQQERARYTSTPRSHQDEFEKHANGQACTTCHLDGKIAMTPALMRRARPFWHALHMVDGSLDPNDKFGTSRTIEGSCESCHSDLGGEQATTLSTPHFQWSAQADAQSECKTCHNEADELLPLKPTPRDTQSETSTVVDFPHDVHVGSKLYGDAGSSLADGCFACHNFSQPAEGQPFSQVPLTLPEAADCTKCHSGHRDIQDNTCEICHPVRDADSKLSNSFLLSAKRFDKQLPKRDWPAQNGFSHLSPGHVELTNCADCHDGTDLEDATSLADVRVPDESAKACRACHLEKQFHWR